MAQGTFYRMWQNGTWNHPTLPPYDPGPTDPGNGGGGDGLLWFGTTIFGQSYANYKKQTINNIGNRYNQVEYDAVWNGQRGGGVSREFNSNNGIQTFSGATQPHQRNNQPICYSFKDGALSNNTPEATFKNELRAWIDSKPGSLNTRVWLVFKHEWDNTENSNKVRVMDDGTPGVGQINNWYERQLWVREVLNGEGGAQYAAAAARNGGWIRFGPISTGVPFQQGRSNNDPISWKTYSDGMATFAGVSSCADIWDFWGMDRYNPSWSSGKYISASDYMLKPTQCHDYTGLPFVVGESGSPRAQNSGTTAQRNAERAAWLDAEYSALKNSGFVDAVMYWRVPSNNDPTNAWSTNMVTPTGFNGTWGGYAGTPAANNGGFDDQLTSDVISEYCINSINEANALAADLGNPTIPFYTGSGGYG